MKIIKKRNLFLGILLLLIPSMRCIDYQKQCESFFLTNKTNHRLKISFCNADHWEQQQYEMEPKEQRSVRVSAEMIKKMAMVRVSIADRKHKKKKHKKGEVQEDQANEQTTMPQVKEIDYDRDASIVGLEIAMLSGELDLKWRHGDEYEALEAPNL